MTQPEALRLAEVSPYLEGGERSQWIMTAAAELRRLHALIAACEPYLKEGETPAERIERDHRDSLALMTLLAREKTKNEALLEALKELELLRMQSLEFMPPEIRGAWMRAHAAIAKAEGEKA